MNILAVIDHPWNKSFTYAVLNAFVSGAEAAGHSVQTIDLNAIGFDPVVTVEELALYQSGKSPDPVIQEHQKLLLNTEHMALFYPIWWMVMPARLKGWFDRVLLPGFAFIPGDIPEPKLTHISGATVFTTTGAPDDVHRSEYGSPSQHVVCDGTLAFCGVTSCRWLNFGLTGVAPREEHEAWLLQVTEYAENL